MLATESDHLYIVTCVFNPTNAPIRNKLYCDFERYLSRFPNVTLVTVELALGNNFFIVTDPDNPYHIRLRTNDVLWYKENLINIGIKSLPPSAKYVAWIDADVEFRNPYWMDQTLTMLRSKKFVQLYDTCNSLGPNGEVLQSNRSFIYMWENGLNTPKAWGQPGGAWAARIDTIRELGGLIDWDIVGASDRHTVFALTNQDPPIENPCMAKNKAWAAKVKAHVDASVGYIDGVLVHFFHGYPSDRGYGTRGRILIDNGFDPDKDIGYREDGLLHLTTDKPKLRQDLITYFESRNDHGPV